MEWVSGGQVQDRALRKKSPVDDVRLALTLEAHRGIHTDQHRHGGRAGHEAVASRGIGDVCCHRDRPPPVVRP